MYALVPAVYNLENGVICYLMLLLTHHNTMHILLVFQLASCHLNCGEYSNLNSLTFFATDVDSSHFFDLNTIDQVVLDLINQLTPANFHKHFLRVASALC